MVVYENISEYIIQMHNETVTDCLTKVSFNFNNMPVYLCSPEIEKTINIIAITIFVIILIFIIYFAYKHEQKERNKDDHKTEGDTVSMAEEKKIE